MFKSHASSHVDLHAAYGMFLNWKSKLLKIHQTAYTDESLCTLVHSFSLSLTLRTQFFPFIHSPGLCCFTGFNIRHNWCVCVSYHIVLTTSLFPHILHFLFQSLHHQVICQIYKQKSMRTLINRRISWQDELLYAKCTIGKNDWAQCIVTSHIFPECTDLFPKRSSAHTSSNNKLHRFIFILSNSIKLCRLAD